MKHLFLLVFFFITFSLSAQDDSYIEFTSIQQKKSKQISQEKLSTTIRFDSGIDYDGTLFWHVIGTDDKEYYFNSTNEFKDVEYEEASYSSLMEYVIETIGF